MKCLGAVLLSVGLASCSIGCQHVNTSSEPKLVGGVAYDQLGAEFQAAMHPVFRIDFGAGQSCSMTLVAPLTFLTARHCFLAVTENNVLPETEDSRRWITLRQFEREPVEGQSTGPYAPVGPTGYTVAAPPVAEDIDATLKKPDILLLRIDEHTLANQAPDFLTLLQNTPPAEISILPEVAPLYAAGYGLKGEPSNDFDRRLTMGKVALYSIGADVITSVWANEEFVTMMQANAMFDEPTRELLSEAHETGGVGFESGDSGGPLFSLVETPEGLRMRIHAVNYSVQRSTDSEENTVLRFNNSERVDGRAKAWLEAEGLIVLSE